MALSFLDRSRTIAPPGWSRWLVPPAALSVHLAIGQAYAWSVFKSPLEKDLGLNGTQSALPFQLGIVMLGLSAAVFGTRVEKNGPRWAMFTSLCCFCGGFLVAALGVMSEQYWLVVLGYGGLGGIGLGIRVRYATVSHCFATVRQPLIVCGRPLVEVKRWRPHTALC